MARSLSAILVQYLVLAALLTPLFTARSALAGNVGLGVAAGAAFPEGENVRPVTSFNWGFFVDIPLISTFYIAPATILYRIDVPGAEKSRAATDVDLNFKFMLPMALFKLYFGITAGLTQAQFALEDGDELHPHVGALAGGGFNLLPNLELFGMAQYKTFLEGDTKASGWYAYLGPLFRF